MFKWCRTVLKLPQSVEMFLHLLNFLLLLVQTFLKLITFIMLLSTRANFYIIILTIYL